MLRLNSKFGCFLLIFLMITAFVTAGTGPVRKDETKNEYSTLVNSLKMRNIGPAIMGGRVVDFAVVESNVSIIYAAIGPSGVWKSENSGTTWEPVFHQEGSVSVGAVAVSQSHSDIVWVGTGEGTSRNSVGIGDGVYKSEDGGRTWKNMGLENTRHIARIKIDPTNPDIVFIGALGHLWGPNPERGVFRTRDGGKTWEKVLYVNDDTGIADLAADPSNSKIVYAAAWDFRRKPFHFRSGGKGSGIYKTMDGGDTWKELRQGLPAGILGRIGLDVCRSNPAVVYAVVESSSGGVYRSDDKGESWQRSSDKRTFDRINFRPFYYSRLTADPNNDLVVYVYSGSSYVSRDGGKTFKPISGSTHPDHHTMWVNPHNSRHIMDGNDGGIDISYDGGKNWHSVHTNAWSEVYQVGYDMRDPYYAYVGLQDNGSWGAPVNSLDPSGIFNFHWYVIGGGDGFYIQVDPEDYATVYRNAHMGGITRFDVRTGDSQSIKPVAPLGEKPYRFNWNSPILLSPHNNKVVYFGGNFLFKTMDGGSSWEKVSPDLSSDDPEKQKDSGGITADNTGAEIHCTVYTIAESFVKEGVIWVGTDDGLVQVTRDGGKIWSNVTKNIKGLPADSWVTRIDASHFAAGTAFATFDRHRYDDYRPYVYKTTDFGKTWTSLSAGLPEVGYLHVVRQDPVNRDLLYVGSEFGLFLSLDNGRTWTSYNNEFPTIAVRDIMVHPRENDLLVGTHGRGLWIMDDIRPLQSLSREKMKSSFELFAVRPATLYSYKSNSMYSGPYDFVAPNPHSGACITYRLKDRLKAADKLNLAIFDSQGNLMYKLRAPKRKGLNRVYWDLREQLVGEPQPEASRQRRRRYSGGPFALPGIYKVELDLNGEKAVQEILVKAFSLHSFTIEERKQNQIFVRDVSQFHRRGTGLIRSMDKLAEQMRAVTKRVKEENITDSAVLDKLKAITVKVTKICSAYSYSVEGATGYRRPVLIALRGGALPEQLSRLRGAAARFQGAPTQTQIDQFENIKSVVEPILKQAEELRQSDIPEINRLLNGIGFPILKF